MTSKIENAKIVRTFLGKEDHDIFTCILTLDFGGTMQGFGLHSLKFESYGIEYLERILKVVGVDSWEKLPGQYIRADHEHTKVNGIGNIIANGEWFYPERDLGGEE